jgi:hypothetical protein
VTYRIPRTLALAGVLLGALTTHAFAQDGLIRASRSLVPAAFPRWDASGSIGILGLAGSETRSSWPDWEQKGEFRFDLGRYWTTHLKTDVAVSATNGWQDYESVRLPVSAPPNTYAFDNINRRLFTIAPAVTWQFRENTFMHPYVSGGVKLGILDEHTVRESGPLRIGSASDTVDPFTSRQTVLTARPFVAGGFKSYVSRSVFVRTEGRVAVAQSGMQHLSVIAGVGVDF